MSNSNQDSGILGAVVAVGILVIVGGVGFFAYQRMRTAQLAIVRAEEMRAMAMAQEAAAQQALLRAQPATPMQPVNDPGPSAAEESIRARLAAQQSDWNQGDLESFMKVYWKSEQLTFASGGKITRGWQATLDGYKSRYSSQEKMGKLAFDELEFQSLGPSAMLVLGTWHLERGADSIGGNFSLIWKKLENEWFIIHDHTSALLSP